MVLAVVVLTVLVLRWPGTSDKAAPPCPDAGAAGGQADWSQFSAATSGTWQMLDASLDILQEPKEASQPADRQKLLVRSVSAQAQLRIVAVQQRWKRVELLEQGKVVATGWVDGQLVKSARLVAKTDPSQPTLFDEQGRDLLGQIVPGAFKDDVTLENAFLVFSMFGVKIELDASVTPEMRKQHIQAVTYENTSLREALTQFCAQYGLEWTLVDKQIVVRKK